MTSPDHQELDAGGCAAAISIAISQLMCDCSGRGPTHAQTTITNDLIVCMLADTLSKGEWKLVEGGEERVVLEQRDAVQRIMRDDAVAAVERLSGRTVTAFMSNNHVDPDCAVEMFLLEPLPRANGYDQAAHRQAGDARPHKTDATRERALRIAELEAEIARGQPERRRESRARAWSRGLCYSTSGGSSSEALMCSDSAVAAAR